MEEKGSVIKSVTDLIKGKLVEGKISVRKLALSVGVSQQHLDMVLKGQRYLTNGLLEKINDYLGTDFKKEPL